jgi:CheY-like chemotaxis protein
VQSGRRAIDMLRLVRCDLLLVSFHLPDMSIWNFLRHIKTNWPQQKWALVSGPLSTQQEVAARMFNVLTFFNNAPAIEDVCQWQNLSDVFRAAQGAPDVAPAKIAFKPAGASGRTVVNRSKQPSTFEITGSLTAKLAGATYAQNASISAV